MRLVLDTNTALSGLTGTVQLLSSVPLLAELEGVLQRPKFREAIQRRGVKVSDLFDGYAALVRCVEPAELPNPVCRDSDDDQVLAAAISGKADLIVSGDDDLLALRSFQGIEIVSARHALTLLGLAQS